MIEVVDFIQTNEKIFCSIAFFLDKSYIVLLIFLLIKVHARDFQSHPLDFSDVFTHWLNIKKITKQISGENSYWGGMDHIGIKNYTFMINKKGTFEIDGK